MIRLLFDMLVMENATPIEELTTTKSSKSSPLYRETNGWVFFPKDKVSFSLHYLFIYSLVIASLCLNDQPWEVDNADTLVNVGININWPRFATML